MKKPPFYIALALTIIVIISFPFCSKILNEKSSSIAEKSGYKAIIEIWQLDMVEGGKGSRQDFLKRVAKKFEKSNPGVMVSVSTLSAVGASEKIKNGIYPDIISYSNGISGFEQQMCAIEKKSDYDVVYEKKCYANAWAIGKYFLFYRKGVNVKNATLYVSQSEFTKPLIAYYLSNYRCNSFEIQKPLDAYAKFLSDSNSCLLGTQRDIFRLLNKEINCEKVLLNEFSDLIQYVSVLSKEKQKADLSKLYINLLCNEAQENLDEIGMFSPLISIYEDGEPLKDFESQLRGKTISPLVSGDALADLQSILINPKANEQEIIERIKNVIQ